MDQNAVDPQVENAVDPQVEDAVDPQVEEAIQNVEADVLAMHAAKRRLMAEMEAKSEKQGLKSHV